MSERVGSVDSHVWLPLGEEDGPEALSGELALAREDAGFACRWAVERRTADRRRFSKHP